MTKSGDIRVALIGAGMMGADHAVRLSNRMSGASLASICDVDGARAKAAVKGIDGCSVVADPIAAINDPNIDAVVVVTPGQTHEDLLNACIERAIPVLCEKPLTLDAESSYRVVSRESDAGLKLIQVGFMRRFDPQYVALKSLVDSERLGRPILLHCAHRAASVPPSFTEAMLVTDAVVHEFDIVRWLTGEEIRRVSVVKPPSGQNLPGGALGPQIVTFETESGIYVDVEINVNCDYGYQVRCELVLERGTMTIGDNVGPVLQERGRWGGAVTSDFRFRFAEAYDAEVQAWINSVHSGIAVGPSAWDGYAAAAVAEAATQAQASGATVSVSLEEKPKLYV